MNPITISALTTHIVALFETDDLLRDVTVTAEVSTWKRAASGHIYFSLKDEGASINAVMWRGSAMSHTWLPQAGDQIVAHGYVGVYPDRGAYQLYVNRIQPAGRGQLYAQFEALKARLAEAGLFDDERKRSIPVQPARIGVVTSADAAAFRDVLHVLSARWPLVDVLLFSTLVQGNEAPARIATAIGEANRYSQEVEPLDTLIVARGGGSIEDLWAFNDERVAYAIAGSEIPVICGVGHETDFTIADFVADLRAPTPSVAASVAVPDRADVMAQLADIRRWTVEQGLTRLDGEQRRLEQSIDRLKRAHPQRQLDQRRQQLVDRSDRLHRMVGRLFEHKQERQKFVRLRLDALNPLGVLQRGYSIVQKSDGEIVTAPETTVPGDMLQVRSAGGDYVVERSA
jgi:exodeoxyribonuclease VII large subunit